MAREGMRRGLAAAGALAVLGLGACDSGSGTAAAPTPEPTASASASVPSAPERPVVVAPERPAAMDDDGVSGAEAAAVYFLELDAYVQATGDTKEWEAMSHASCDYCRERLEQARRIADQHAVFEGGAATVTISHSYLQDEATGIWPFDVEIHEARTVVTAADGTIAFDNPANTSTARVEVGRANGTWVVVTVADTPN